MTSNAFPRRLVIAVDGPAASGKGTLGHRLAAHYGLPHLDTGLLYRAVGRKYLLSAGKDEATAIAAAKALSVADLADKSLHDEATGQAASIVSAIPDVRAALLDYQRQFANHPKGAVLDGRDIGTVICPDATVKLFITATAEVRAERRFKQAALGSVTYQEVLTAIQARDARDTSRSAAPLKIAEDAVVIDTSAMGIEDVLAHAISHINTLLKLY